MKRRILGKDLEVSAIGLGCMGMSRAYGAPADRKEMTELLAQAVDMGYTFFDTAEVYGTDDDPHDNEKLLGEALKSYRNRIVLASKFGLTFDKSEGKVPYPLLPDSRPETIRKSIEGTLSRLRTDHLDLYYQHRVDPDVPIEEVAGVMSELIQEGKITHWGISEAKEKDIKKAHRVCPVTAIQNRYSMMYREYEKLFPLLEELNIGFVPFSPLANGLLSDYYTKDSNYNEKGDYRRNMPQFQPEAFDTNRDLFRLIRNAAKEHHATPAQISLAWMMNKKSWIVPIPGTRKPERLRENAGATEIELSIAEINAMDEALNHMKMSDVFGGSKITKK